MLNLCLVLIAPGGSSALAPARTEEIKGLLLSFGRIEEDWLAEGEAWQAGFTVKNPAEAGAIRAAAARMLHDLPVDVNLVPNDPNERRKQLLVADMESTIIGQELIDELAGRAGIGAEISEITARAMLGEIEFETSLRERIARFKGIDVAVLDEVYARATLNPGAETLVATMKRNGATCALVSGGFTVFTERIAARVGFDIHQANTLGIAGGKLAGTVAEPILGRAAKREALERLAAERGLRPNQTLAVGDGANDLDMIRAAGLGVAFRAKPVVAAEAAASVVNGDLTALLYLQGYRKDEFAAGSRF